MHHVIVTAWTVSHDSSRQPARTSSTGRPNAASTTSQKQPSPQDFLDTRTSSERTKKNVKSDPSQWASASTAASLSAVCLSSRIRSTAPSAPRGAVWDIGYASYAAVHNTSFRPVHKIATCNARRSWPKKKAGRDATSAMPLWNTGRRVST